MTPSTEGPHSSLLLLAEVDHACGDIVSSVMQDLLDEGVWNINLVPSITKKGRPGYLLYIDLPADSLERVETIIVSELGVLGWRVLHAEHRHAEVEHRSTMVTLSFPGGRSIGVDVPFKVMAIRDAEPSVQVEHDFCVLLKRRLADELGITIPLRGLKAQLQAMVAEQTTAGPLPTRRRRKESER